MGKGYRHIVLTAGSALGALMIAQAAQAQEARAPASQGAQAEQEAPAATEEIVVVGTQIKGASTTAALPVSVIDA
ncbi:hypothetical protein GY977_22855, partial [Escherichia coli]|nr:hypothetical protein [Escherichia coli]